MLAVKHIEKTFKEAINKCFPKCHILHQIIKEHCTKLSYNTMPNTAMKIGGQNNKIEK